VLGTILEAAGRSMHEKCLCPLRIQRIYSPTTIGATNIDLSDLQGPFLNFQCFLERHLISRAFLRALYFNSAVSFSTFSSHYSILVYRTFINRLLYCLSIIFIISFLPLGSKFHSIGIFIWSAY
jgi:hypothetical protein